MRERGTKRPPGLYTLFEFRGTPFRIDVAWNPHADEWQWVVDTRVPHQVRLMDEIYNAVNPALKRMRHSNMREAVAHAVKEGLHKLAGGAKRWGLIDWDGVWFEHRWKRG